MLNLHQSDSNGSTKQPLPAHTDSQHSPSPNPRALPSTKKKAKKEPLEMESLYPFPETIIIQDRATALAHGLAFSSQLPRDRRLLVLWIDASISPKDTLASAAVRYFDSRTQRWTESITLATLRRGSAYSYEAEFIAHQRAQTFDRLVVFSDCQSVLRSLRDDDRDRGKARLGKLTTPGLVDALFLRANALYDEGIGVEVRWVPAHSRVEENERVDQLARQVRRFVLALLERRAARGVVDGVTSSSCSRQVLLRDL